MSPGLPAGLISVGTADKSMSGPVRFLQRQIASETLAPRGLIKNGGWPTLIELAGKR